MLLQQQITTILLLSLLMDISQHLIFSKQQTFSYVFIFWTFLLNRKFHEDRTCLSFHFVTVICWALIFKLKPRGSSKKMVSRCGALGAIIRISTLQLLLTAPHCLPSWFPMENTHPHPDTQSTIIYSWAKPSYPHPSVKIILRLSEQRRANKAKIYK